MTEQSWEELWREYMKLRSEVFNTQRKAIEEAGAQACKALHALDASYLPVILSIVRDAK